MSYWVILKLSVLSPTLGEQQDEQQPADEEKPG